MTEAVTTIASQAGHWYDRETGEPMYELPCTSKEGNRPTTIRDARKLDLVPSVTLILNAIAKPALESWKAKQLLEASLTLPWNEGEAVDDYAKRVMEDAKAQGIAAAERGTQLHAAIERYIAGETSPQWERHITKLESVLGQHGIELVAGKPEHSFSAEINGLFYGGKVDYHDVGTVDFGDKKWRDSVVCDFKSKDKIDDGKRLAWDEHALQIAAYGYGLFGVAAFRGLNVFVGVNDCEVRVVEHDPADLEHAFSMFQDILSYWSKKNRFGPYANGRQAT